MTSAEVLSNSGIKPSVQRIAILDWLTQHPVHPTVEEVYSALAPSIPTLSKTTVYNTLELFHQNGVAQCIYFDEMHFDANTSPHAHFICSHCGKVQDIMMDLDETYRRLMIQGQGCGHQLDIKQVEVNYFGICQQCKNQV